MVLLLAGCGGGGSGQTGSTSHPRFSSFRVPSVSMEPTYHKGDIVQVKLDAYSRSAPRVGDVVVFNPPRGANFARCGVSRPPEQACPRPTSQRLSTRYFQRVVGTPGQRLSVIAGRIYVGGKRLKEPYAKPSSACPICNQPRPITIPPDHYFMVGDNRGESDDSRDWGPVPKAWILGKVIR